MKIFRVRLRHKDKPGIARQWLKIVSGDKVLFVVGTVVGTIAKVVTESTILRDYIVLEETELELPRGDPL